MQALDETNMFDEAADTVNQLEVGAAQQHVPNAQSLSHPAPVEHQPGTSDVLKVSTRSRPSAVAGAIAGVMRQRGSVEVQSIGAGATNQAIKAVAIAHAYLWDEGIRLCCVPIFVTIMIDGDTRTGIQLLVQQQPTGAAPV